MLEKVKLQRFTVFEELKLSFSPGINIFIGENGTGKTHLMKVLYAACDIIKEKEKGNFAEKLIKVFLPSKNALGRLTKRASGSSSCQIEITRRLSNNDTRLLKLSFSNHSMGTPTSVKGMSNWADENPKCVFIPVKDMLANAPGFSSLYEMRNIHFEEIYVDIIRRAFLPALKGPATRERKQIENILVNAINGKVLIQGEEFFLKNAQGNLEFTLLAEGFRKLGLLWLLLQNGTLLQGSVLFWDEPETNLNPKLIQAVISVLLELQRMGVQIFLATHNYSVLKEFDLQKQKNDQVIFNSMFRNENGEIVVNSTPELVQLVPNAIDETYEQMLGRDIQKNLGL